MIWLNVVPHILRCSVIAVSRRFTREFIAINRQLPAVLPIKYGLGYRSQTLTLNLNPNPNPKSNNNVCSTKRHPNKVQHCVIYKLFSLGRGWVYKGPITQSENHPQWCLVNRGDHWWSKRAQEQNRGWGGVSNKIIWKFIPCTLRQITAITFSLDIGKLPICQYN